MRHGVWVSLSSAGDGGKDSFTAGARIALADGGVELALAGGRVEDSFSGGVLHRTKHQRPMPRGVIFSWYLPARIKKISK